jgi:uncharacterized membrane protein
MRMTYVVHIAAGSLGLLAGFVALYSVKGATLHRKAGIVFVYAMLATCVAGFAIAALRGVAPAVNIPAALLTASMVVTAVTTLRPPTAGARWVDRGATLIVLVVALAVSRSPGRRSPTAARETGCRRSRSSCSVSSDCWRPWATFG